MSAVWRVTREAAAREVYALKTLRYEKAATTTAYQRFAREIEILTRLQPHDGIVPVVDSSLSGDGTELYCVMP